MARDPAGATPRGALSRHPADWFSESFYVGNHFDPNDGPLGTERFIQVGLYNQDPQGRVMRIWGAEVNCDGGEGFAVLIPSGSVAAKVGTATSIRPDRPPPSVDIYAQQAILPNNSANPFVIGQTFGQLATFGFDGGILMSPFPLWIVPVGYSLVVTNRVGGGFINVTIWFQLANY